MKKRKFLCIIMLIISMSFVFTGCRKEEISHVHNYDNDRICECGKLDPCYTFLELVDAHDHKSKYFVEFDAGLDTYFTDFTIGYDNKGLEAIYLLSVQTGKEYGSISVTLPILLVSCTKPSSIQGTERGYLYYSIYNESGDSIEEGKIYIVLNEDAYRGNKGVVSNIGAELKRGVKNFLKITFKNH